MAEKNFKGALGLWTCPSNLYATYYPVNILEVALPVHCLLWAGGISGFHLANFGKQALHDELRVRETGSR